MMMDAVMHDNNSISSQSRLCWHIVGDTRIAGIDVARVFGVLAMEELLNASIHFIRASERAGTGGETLQTLKKSQAAQLCVLIGRTGGSATAATSALGRLSDPHLPCYLLARV